MRCLWMLLTNNTVMIGVGCAIDNNRFRCIRTDDGEQINTIDIVQAPHGSIDGMNYSCIYSIESKCFIYDSSNGLIDAHLRYNF